LANVYAALLCRAPTWNGKRNPPDVLKFLRDAHIGNVDFRQLDGSSAWDYGGRRNRR
jgi:hypothetical protein